MAVAQSTLEGRTVTAARDRFQGRHLVIGANVAISVVIATAIVGIVQWAAYFKNAKADMTDQGANSLAPWTEEFFKNLDQKVRLTSMYFQTDLEDEDQGKYRTRVNDLITLYQSVNPSKVEVERFNPLQDHAQRAKFLDRIQNLKKFKEQAEPYKKLIEQFQDQTVGKIGALVQGELDAITGLLNTTADEDEKDALGQIQQLLERWQREIELTVRDLDDAVGGTRPRYGTAKGIVTGLAGNLPRDLKSVIDFAQKRVDRNTNMTPAVVEYLSGASERYQPIIDELEDLSTKTTDLPELEIDRLLQQISPTSNALVVETEEDAKVLAFNDIWPPANPDIPAGAARFSQRLFSGEEKITTATIQLTEKEKTAITFVRFAGPPLFFGMPGAPQQPPYMMLKEQLEDANFVVNEWDVSSADEPPTVDPPPARTIYIVLRPSPPAGNPMMQQQEPQFSEAHKQKVLAKLGDNPRAIFLAGWMPGPFGAFPEPYPYDSYLNDTWGIHVASDLLVQRVFMGQKPGEYALAQQSWILGDVSRSDHLIVKDLQGRPTAFPFVSPLEITAKPPEGVTVERLLWCERSDDLWGVKNVQQYVENARAMRGIHKDPDDMYGPFNVAAAAEKGDGKIVVISSRSCMIDAFAMARALALTPEGFTFRQQNPGNVQLLLNSLHWLNDKTEWMNVGAPVDVGTIAIDPGSELTFIRAFVFAIWPAMAAVCGAVAWWVRRS